MSVVLHLCPEYQQRIAAGLEQVAKPKQGQRCGDKQTDTQADVERHRQRQVILEQVAKPGRGRDTQRDEGRATQTDEDTDRYKETDVALLRRR